MLFQVLALSPEVWLKCFRIWLALKSKTIVSNVSSLSFPVSVSAPAHLGFYWSATWGLGCVQCLPGTFLLQLVTGMVRCMRGYFPHEHIPVCRRGNRLIFWRCLLWEQVPSYFGRACKHERELCCVTGHQHVLFSGCSVSVSFVNKPWSCAHVHVRGVSSPWSLHVTMSRHNTINEMQTRRRVRNKSRFFWSQLLILCVP